MSAEDELISLREEKTALLRELNRLGEHWEEACNKNSELEKGIATLREEKVALEKALAGQAKPSADLSSLPIGEQLALLEKGLQENLASVAELHAEIDKRKEAVAGIREAVVVVAPKAYAVPGQGNILPQKGQRITKTRQPGLFAAIVSQGRVGVHFHFVAP